MDRVVDRPSFPNYLRTCLLTHLLMTIMITHEWYTVRGRCNKVHPGLHCDSRLVVVRKVFTFRLRGSRPYDRTRETTAHRLCPAFGVSRPTSLTVPILPTLLVDSHLSGFRLPTTQTLHL